MSQECPACVDESFIEQQFPTLDIAGCRSVKVRTAPIEHLCEVHRKERDRIDSGLDKTPIERMVDGYPLRWVVNTQDVANAPKLQWVPGLGAKPARKDKL